MSETDKISIGIVVAFCDGNQGISYKGDVAWPYLRVDHEFYMNLVKSTVDPGKKNGVLLGRLCWETMRAEDKPKVDIVVTSTTMKAAPQNCRAVVSGYNEAIEEMMEGVRKGQLEKLWVLGGRRNYQYAIDDPRVTQIIATRIFKQFQVDGFFPEFEHKFKLVKTSDVYTDNGVTLQFETWERKENSSVSSG